MFADYIKIAAKWAAIIAAFAIAITILTYITFPTFDLTLLTTAVGKGKAILSYYLGTGGVSLLNAGIGLLFFKYIFIPTIRITLIAFRVINKVNE